MARNRALEVSSGQLIAFLDCDDWWDLNYLSSREKILTTVILMFFTVMFYLFTKKEINLKNIEITIYLVAKFSIILLKIILL